MLKILTHPINKVIFEYTLDKLVEEVWGYQLVNIRTRKMFGEWLTGRVRESPPMGNKVVGDFTVTLSMIPYSPKVSSSQMQPCMHLYVLMTVRGDLPGQDHLEVRRN
jgi:hypothetical protein